MQNVRSSVILFRRVSIRASQLIQLATKRIRLSPEVAREGLISRRALTSSLQGFPQALDSGETMASAFRDRAIQFEEGALQQLTGRLGRAL
jgi:hypothetical protein